jgi:GntR family transcriptional regulator/MocR family aminotransferase
MQPHAVDLLVTLDRSDGATEGLTRQVYAQVREAIIAGRLRPGERLPPTREFARRLGVARLTVATAYEWLRAEGYVVGRVGAGTFVAAVFIDGAGGVDLPDGTLPAAGTDHQQRADGQITPAGPARLAEATPPAPIPLSAWALRIATIPLGGSAAIEPRPFDFRPSLGAAEVFPWARWRRIVGWLDSSDPRSLRREAQGQPTAGFGQWDALLGPLETREAIASWLRRSRAVRCGSDQLLVAGSVQQMLALLARLLVEPGQQLIVEDPSYVGFHAAFLAEGARLVGIPVDAGGLVTQHLPNAPARAEPASRLAVVTPSHQYPLGVTLALDRRVALLEWARRAGVVVVEDDYDGDLRLEGQPLEALRGLDDRDEVIYLGTFAKALYPATRLAYAVLPRWLVEPVARARAASDRHPAWRDALAVSRFIASGDLERHLARVRRLYRARRDALVAALWDALGDAVTIGPAEAGMHLVVAFPDHVDDVALAGAAAGAGVAVTPLSPHYAGAPQRGLLLGFGGQHEEGLRAGIARLAPVILAAVRGSRYPGCSS